jgi:hypothetical protein
MKQNVKEQVYLKEFKGDCADVRFSDLPKDIQDNDIIEIHREDSFFSENESYGAYTELVIIREREETDEEYNKRIERGKRINESEENLNISDVSESKDFITEMYVIRDKDADSGVSSVITGELVIKTKSGRTYKGNLKDM